MEDYSGNEINEGEMKDAIWKSSYLLQLRAADALNQAGYWVDTNRRIVDEKTAKSRDYDIYAYKEINLFDSDTRGLHPTILADCKNNKNPLVFFVQDDTFQPLVDEITLSGMPCKVWMDEEYVSMQEFLKMESLHHYCQPAGPVSTQYCTFEKKNDAWLAFREESSPDVFRSLAEALEAEVDNHFADFKQVLREEGKGFVDLNIYYPLVVVGGELYTCHLRNDNILGKDGLNLKRVNHIQYNPEFQSSYSGNIVSYHVDVIAEEYLPSYLRIIEKEAGEIAARMNPRREEVEQSINMLYDECMEAEDTESCRNILEYEF